MTAREWKTCARCGRRSLAQATSYAGMDQRCAEAEARELVAMGAPVLPEMVDALLAALDAERKNLADEMREAGRDFAEMHANLKDAERRAEDAAYDGGRW